MLPEVSLGPQMRLTCAGLTCEVGTVRLALHCGRSSKNENGLRPRIPETDALQKSRRRMNEIGSCAGSSVLAAYGEYWALKQGGTNMRVMPHLIYGAALVGLLSAGAALAQEGSAKGDTSKKRIGLTDGFSSNSWEQSAWNAWKTVAGQAVKDGVIAEQKIITGNDEPAQQITQLQNLVLEGYDAIVIDAASPTALNGAIKEACEAGIIVVVYDSLATEPCAIKVNVDYRDYGVQETNFMAEALGKKGNILEIRGVAGSQVDIDISAGI